MTRAPAATAVRDLASPHPAAGEPLPRRLLDAGAAAAALLLLAPSLLLIAVAIRLEDGGPVLFAQQRVGQGGGLFALYKFRKFRARGSLPASPLTSTNDPRLSRLGRFLEATKLDELPQFWNVLIGDMSLVGPRPETPHFGDCFHGSCRELLRYKPGIFGPSQAVFRREGALHAAAADPEQHYRAVLFPMKARLDLAYCAQRSVGRDIAWVGRCVLAILGLPFMRGQRSALPDQVEGCLRLIASEADRGRRPAVPKPLRPARES